MGLVVHRPQPRDRDVGVELRRGQRRVAEQFLDDAQVGAALEQVGGRAVAQPVRADVRCPVDRGDRLVHDRAGLPLIEAAAAGTDQQRRARLRRSQCGAPVGQPRRQRRLGRLAERDGALLVSLAQHPQQPAGCVDVIDVQAAQLADPNAGGVQQLDDEQVPQCERITLLRTRIGGGHGIQRLILTQHRGQRSTRLGELQPGGRIARQQTASGCPGGEGLDRRGAPRQRGAGRAGRCLGGQPRPQNRQAQAGDVGVGNPLTDEFEQRPQIAEIGATGVRRSGRAPTRGTRRTRRGSHPLSYRRRRWRSGSADAPQCLGPQFFQRAIAVDGHGDVGFGQ